MTLEELSASLTKPKLSVPEWAVGTVWRRSISFATGFSDDSTAVRWVQSHGMTGDIRILATRPILHAADRLEDLELKTLILLASVEGGVASTSWHDGVMSWGDWTGFQPYDKYPEPGILQRIGDCMIEVAPSKTYVEDWRFQPSAPGLLAGLQLIRETDTAGRDYARSGGLVIAGDHAICSIARLNELPDGVRAQDYVRDSKDPVAALRQVFECTVDYAAKQLEEFMIITSTDRRRERTPVGWTTGFSLTAEPGIVVQQVTSVPGISSRTWRIHSLENDVAFPLTTDIIGDRKTWLDAEADTLIEPHRARGTGRLACA